MMRVVLTDHPWPNLDIEHNIFAAAGIDLTAGPSIAGDEKAIEKLVDQANPHAILTCWAPVTKTAIQMPRDLRIVARLGVGLDNIAVRAATARGAWVTNVPDYCVQEVSDHAVGLLLAHFRGIVKLDRGTKAGRWDPTSAPVLERISNLTVGVIGFGRIGRETARKLSSFRCRILAYSPNLMSDEAGVEAVTLATVQSECDVIFLHAPLTKDTYHLIGEEFLRGCKRAPLIVNASRGGLVDNAALLKALSEGLVRGAALDVVEGEPDPPKEILEHERTIVTPHISFLSTASLAELRSRACQDVVRVLGGEEPLNPCGRPESK